MTSKKLSTAELLRRVDAGESFAAIAKDAGEQALKDAYKVFKDEAQCLKPKYTPTTVNIDGWKATANAWLSMFSSVVIIYCFLHVFIKIRDR